MHVDAGGYEMGRGAFRLIFGDMGRPVFDLLAQPMHDGVIGGGQALGEADAVHHVIAAHDGRKARVLRACQVFHQLGHIIDGFHPMAVHPVGKGMDPDIETFMAEQRGQHGQVILVGVIGRR